MKNKSKQSASKTNSVFKKISTLSFFWAGGFIAGFLSLGISILLRSLLGNLSFWAGSTFLFIIVLVLVEEVMKFSLINFMLTTTRKIEASHLVKGFIFGFGFAIFELVLITGGTMQISDFSPLLIFAVHIITSMIITNAALNFKNKDKSFIGFFFLAVILHLAYNLAIASVI